MSLRGVLRGSIFSRGVSGGGGSAPPAPLNPPTILTFTLDDMTLDTGVPGTFSWTKSGTQTGAVLDPGDGSGNYTLTTESSQAHTYDTEGVYDATLTVSNAGGSDTAFLNDVVVVSPASSVAFKNWGEFSSATETMRNATGSTVADVPMYRLWQFHRGAVPTTKTLQLRDPDNNIVPTNAWQWDSRVTYPDGSLQSCIVRYYGPASWSTATDKQWTVEAITGSWPAETSSHTVSELTSASDVNITLTGVRRIGPNDDTSQPDHTYTTLTWSLNYWIAQTGRWRRGQAMTWSPRR